MASSIKQSQQSSKRQSPDATKQASTSYSIHNLLLDKKDDENQSNVENNNNSPGDDQALDAVRLGWMMARTAAEAQQNLYLQYFAAAAMLGSPQVQSLPILGQNEQSKFQFQ